MRFLTLAIETSCDETAAAVVVNGTEVLSNQIASQISEHQVFGGVVPEIAARQHLEAVIPVTRAALTEAGVTLDDIHLIAVTAGPGLVGALLVGVAAAKAIAYARKLPLVAVNHVEGHIYANMLEPPPVEPPLVCLTVSGGHTDLLYVPEYGRYEVLGRTRDDAAGESFDKVARVLGLSYPGGPEIEKLARQGDPARIKMPLVRPSAEILDFSFSGLKTAALNVAHRAGDTAGTSFKADLAAAFQKAVIDQLVDRAVEALTLKHARNLLVSGGVASNGALRRAISEACQARKVSVHVPSPHFCTDNAAMIASAGYFRFLREGQHGAGLDINAYPEMQLT